MFNHRLGLRLNVVCERPLVCDMFGRVRVLCVVCSHDPRKHGERAEAAASSIFPGPEGQPYIKGYNNPVRAARAAR